MLGYQYKNVYGRNTNASAKEAKEIKKLTSKCHKDGIDQVQTQNPFKMEKNNIIARNPNGFKVGPPMLIDTRIRWSELSTKNTNFILLKQTTFIWFNGHIIDLETGKPADAWEKENIIPNLKSVDVFDENHFIYDVMTRDIPEHDHKYFLVEFSNGYKLICKSWTEFLNHV